ncbi:sodium-dependent dicarboxylate transporter SdcS [Oxobacter pfennigii]|uniref:Sodium-dependent dicarboxylate transporter SdcS n=1 Tax=Oxobacter pfennigii TaxID=36849 RepID=A0A0P8W1V0_9CLOT|nr:SLC13 family permease [Oxobacter pfennigii]KPU42498.1 sodium-dependent dicarboxylate transporter SdcS [Oxobacter pfennigii]
MNFLKDYKHYIITLVLGLAIKLFVQPVNGLTPVGVNVLAIFLPTLYLWVFVGTEWVSFLAIVGIIITGVLTQTEVFAQSFGHSVVPMIISTMALNVCMTETGVIQKVSTKFVTLKIVHNRPYMFIFMFNLACLLLGFIVGAGALTIIFMALAKNVCEDIGYKQGDPFYTCLMAGVMWQVAFTASATPIGKALPLILMGAAKTSHGIEISFAQWMAVGIPFAFVAFLVSMLVVIFVWRPDTSKYKNYDIEAVKQRSKPLSTEGKITAAIFVVVVILWIFPDFFGALAPGFAAFLKSAGTVVPPVLAIALLCVIRINGKPIGDFTKMARSVPMGLIVFVACVCVLGNAVSSPKTGISEFLKNLLAPVTAGLPPIAIVAFAFLGSIILTNFISNTVTMLLFYSIALSLLQGTTVSMPGLVIMIGLMSSVAFLTPAASVTTPITFGTGDVTVANTLKPNLVLIAAVFIATMVAVWPFIPMLL